MEAGQRVAIMDNPGVEKAHAADILPRAQNPDAGKSRRVWFLIPILILAAFLRFYHFTSTPPGLYADEAMDGNNAAEVAQTGHFRAYYAEDNGREGLYVNLIAVFLKIWPLHEPWVVRLPAAVAGILTVCGLYFLVSRLFGYDVGLLAAFLLATSFWHINFSRIGYRVILSPLFLTWSLYLLVQSLSKESSALSFDQAKPARWWKKHLSAPYVSAALAGIVYGLGFYTYISYRITPLLFLVFIPFFRKNAGFWGRVAVFILFTFVTAAPIGYHFAKHPSHFSERMSQVSVTDAPHPSRLFASNFGNTLLMFNVRGDDNWGHNISGAPELFWPVGILFVVGIILSIYALARRYPEADRSGFISSLPRFGLSLTFLWFILAATPPSASTAGVPSALRSLLMLPAAIILAAIGGIWLYRMVRDNVGKSAARSLAGAFIIVVAWFAYYEYLVVWARNPIVHHAFDEQYVKVGREINALPRSTQKYVVVTAPGYLARGIPVPAETTMFITDSFTLQGQAEHHIRYLLPDQIGAIPPGTPSNTIFYVRWP